MNNPEAIVFDLDGTLVDTIRDIADAMNRTLSAEGYEEKPIDFYLTAIGDGVYTLLKRCIHPQTIDRARENEIITRFKEDYADNLIIHSHLYPGIEALLDRLEAQNIPKAILSNKPDLLTRIIVNECLGEWTFIAVQGQLDGIAPKPDPNMTLTFLDTCGFHPSTTCMVGDTRTDMDTATAAGMIPIGVSWGFRKEKELKDHGAHAIIHAPDQLFDVLPFNPVPAL